MSIWRAPLLILGILLILLAAGAIAAPWLVDFNRYKPQLERLGTQLAGRKVTIGGDVELVLFPWPAARLRDVRVAGDAGGRFGDLLRVEEVRAQLSLPALLAARLEVEQVTLKRPVLALEHAGGGKGNWQLSGHAAGGLPLAPERIALDAIRIEDGRVLLSDRRMRGRLVISRIDASLRAPRVTGPWRLRGSWRLAGRKWRVWLSTGVWQAQQPLSISLRLEPPAGQAGYVVRVDGELEREAGGGGQPRFSGRLAVAPAIPEGRSDPLDPVRQVELEAALTLTPEALALDDVKVTPRFSAASPFETVRGHARLEFGPVLGARMSLQTPRLEVNRALGRLLGAVSGAAAADSKADGLTLLRRHLLAMAARLAGMPADMLLEVDLQAASVRVAGRTFSGVVLSAEASSELLAVHHLRADVPGQGALSFRGNLLAGDMLQLTGEIDVRAQDARALVYAVSPAARRLLGAAWRGRAGRLALLATLDLTEHALRLVSRQLTLEEASLSLDWRLHEPDRGGSGRESLLRLRAEVLDVDRHLRGPRGLMALAAALREWVAGDGGGVQLDVEVQRLRLAGMEWRDVVLAAGRRPGQLQLRQLRVGDAGGLRVNASGDFRQDDRGWRGGLKAEVKGERAAALWRLAGYLAGRREMPAWVRRLGAVDVVLQLDVDDDGRQRQLQGELKGRSGPLRLHARASGVQGGKGRADWRSASWKLQGRVESDRAAPLLALAGMDLELPQGAARVVVSASGVPATGMTGALNVELPGADWRAQGTVRLVDRQGGGAPAGGLPLQGTARVTLTLDDVATWARLADVALPYGAPVKGSLQVAFAPRRLQVSQLALQVADNRLAGQLTLAWPAAGAMARLEQAAATVRGRIVAARLDPAVVLVAVLGSARHPLRLRPRMAGGRVLDVTVLGDALVLPGGGARLAAARLTLRGGGDAPLRLQLRAGGKGAARMQLAARMQRVELGLDVKGTLQAQLPLAEVLRSADGKVRVAGDAALSLSLAGRPATLQGLALALGGSGELAAREVWLEGLAPGRLLKLVRGIATEAQLERFDSLARAALMQGRQRLPQALRVQLRLADGLLEVVPLEMMLDGVRMRVSGLLEVASRRLDVTLGFAEGGDGGVPPFAVNLAGEPGALEVTTDLAAVRDWAQQQVIRRKEEELKRLEEERRRLEEQARKLEEKARLEEERRRQERMRQQADALHRRLQEVLAGAWRQMRVEAARQGGEAVATPGGAPGLRTLLRQLREEGEATVLPGRANLLPRAARAVPRAFADGDRSGGRGRAAAADGSAAPGDVRENPSAGSGKAAQDGEGGRAQAPLTNWNLFAPPR